MNAWKLAIPALVSAALLSLAVADSAAAKKKKKVGGAPKSACDLTYFPLVAGNAWTFSSGSAEVKLKVLSVGLGEDELGKQATLIKVEESFGTNITETQWVCTAEKGLRVSTDSFMFSGEPGPTAGSTVTWTSHEDVWLHPDGHIVKESGWQEKLKGDVTRPDTGGRGVSHAPARLEVERYVVVKEPEQVDGPFYQGAAVKVEFQLRGRAIIGEESVPLLTDDKIPGAVWFVEGFGPVRIKDNLKAGKTWELTGSSMPVPM